MSNWNRAIEVSADLLRVEVETGTIFADIALSSHDSLKRIRNTKKAKAVYAAVLRWIDRVPQSQAESIAASFESLNYKLIVLGEMDAEMLGRRLDDRIPKLAAIAEDFPGDSPMRQRITDQIKAEISEYFEREKNPRYDADRRSPKGHAQNGKSSRGVSDGPRSILASRSFLRRHREKHPKRQLMVRRSLLAVRKSRELLQRTQELLTQFCGLPPMNQAA